MANGQTVAERIRESAQGGIPWMAILDADGQKLITSDGPQGNIGFPVGPQAIDHFIAMLESTATRITAEQLTQVRQRLDENAKEFLNR